MKDQLITLGRQWLEHAPAAKPGAQDLLGFCDPLEFVCCDCSGRILGRGCSLRQIARIPIWQDDAARAPQRGNGPHALTCDLCGKSSPLTTTTTTNPQ